MARLAGAVAILIRFGALNRDGPLLKRGPMPTNSTN
jgi:hypothetical protein